MSNQRRRLQQANTLLPHPMLFGLVATSELEHLNPVKHIDVRQTPHGLRSLGNWQLITRDSDLPRARNIPASSMQYSVTRPIMNARRVDKVPSWPTPTSNHCILKNFYFHTGEQLPELHLHYWTLGELRRDASGRAINAVLITHGTGGSGEQFLCDIFAGELFNPGQPLDATRYFIILRDGIGHGKSSKPSDGMRAKFPKYGYQDMVRADHVMLTEKLGVDHLRLVMGTSMGGMQSWLWAGHYPDFMDAALPLASLPVQISGRNRMTRRAIMDSILNDPEYKGGDYEKQPTRGLTSAFYTFMWMSSRPLQFQKEAPDQVSADDFLDQYIESSLGEADANDLLYAFSASRDYNPQPLLQRIKAPLLAVNSADDQINPPELGILEEAIKKVQHGRAVVLPISDETRGHGTHTRAKLWKNELLKLLEKSGP